MARPSIDTRVILEAAADLLARHGPTRTTMEDIAARAGVAKGVLYLRFSSKDALLRAVVDHEMAQALTVTREAVASDPRGGLLSRLFVHSLTALHSRPFLVALYQNPGGRSPGGPGNPNSPGDPDNSTGPDTPGSPARPVSRSLYRSRSLLGVDFLRDMAAHGMLREGTDPSALATNLALWNTGLAATAPHDDVDTLILSMGTLIARAADADTDDTTPGKECFERLADRLAREWEGR